MTERDAEWQAAHERSPLRITPQNAGRWREFWSLDSDYYLKEIREEAPFYELVVDRLADEGWLLPDDIVLDIGSGPGTLALPLSRRVKKVIALDEAEGMLRTLLEECASRGVTNISTISSSWEDFRGEGEHDLVLASQSPAIRSGTDLFAMERASRDRCCLIMPCPSDAMSTRNELWELVVGEFLPSDAYSSKYPVDLLRERGRSVEVHCVKGEVETVRSVEDVVEHYVRYFSIFTEMSGKKVEAIEEYVLSRSEGGKYIRRNGKCMDLICWKV